jgi:hypothetical protein
MLAAKRRGANGAVAHRPPLDLHQADPRPTAV